MVEKLRKKFVRCWKKLLNELIVDIELLYWASLDTATTTRRTLRRQEESDITLSRLCANKLWVSTRWEHVTIVARHAVNEEITKSNEKTDTNERRLKERERERNSDIKKKILIKKTEMRLSYLAIYLMILLNNLYIFLICIDYISEKLRKKCRYDVYKSEFTRLIDAASDYSIIYNC